MRTMVIIPHAEGGTLELRDVSEPVPGPSDVLVRVKATPLNRADLAQRRGAYLAPVKAGESGLAMGGWKRLVKS